MASPSPTVSGGAPATNRPSSAATLQTTQSSEAMGSASTGAQQSPGGPESGASDFASPEPSSSNALDVLTKAQSTLAPQSNSGNAGVLSQGPDSSHPHAQADSSTSSEAIGTIGSPTSEKDPEDVTSFPSNLLSTPAEQANPTAVVGEALSIISDVGSNAQSVPSANDPQNTVVGIGSNVVIINPSATTVVQAGGTAIIGSQTFAANSDGVDLDGSSASLLASIAATESSSADPPAAVWTSRTQEISAHLESSGIVLQAPDATTTIPQGSLATFAGQTISADTSAQAIHVDGSSIPLSSPQPSSTGEHFSYSPQNTEASSITALAFPSDSTTLLPGSAVTLSGTTYSLPSNPAGNIIYINGQSSSMHLTSAQEGPVTFSQELLASSAETESASLPAFVSPSSSANETAVLTSTFASTAQQFSSSSVTGAPSQTAETSAATGKSFSLLNALPGLITVSLLLLVA